jgi:hypothetical protein
MQNMNAALLEGEEAWTVSSSAAPSATTAAKTTTTSSKSSPSKTPSSCSPFLLLSLEALGHAVQLIWNFLQFNTISCHIKSKYYHLTCPASCRISISSLALDQSRRVIKVMAVPDRLNEKTLFKDKKRLRRDFTQHDLFFQRDEHILLCYEGNQN